jgi:oligopeptide/dipeptide ABC transporter ATP-binding protein
MEPSHPHPQRPAGNVLSVKNLTVSFRANAGVVNAVRGIDISVARRETVALVGESGSGKSASVLGMLGLFHRQSTFLEADGFEFEGMPIPVGDRSQLRRLLGTSIGVVFQDPQSSLNPTMRVGRQIGEVLRLRQGMSRDAVHERVLERLHEVGIRDPGWCATAYPHELSGGMRQRAMIAMAMVANPALLVADEPTTALDVTLQAQIVDLLARLQQDHDTGILFITHDLSLVSEFADRVMVMYAGRVVESGTSDDIVGDPQHPYTRALLESVPRIDGGAVRPIRGRPPDPRELPSGCPFRTRCDHAHERCAENEPPSFLLPSGRTSRCWLAEQDGVAC